MSVWYAAALVLILAQVQLLWRLARGHLLGAIAALQAGAVLSVLVLMCLSEGMGQTSFLDLAVALALLTAPGGLVFARFLERWA
ncbi:MAG: hypothetical protein J2P43_04380 [Candidatus Dormibacteraeota bacterium]|nr:hypothetical protein [Candidatus Dormibacteraeota bacterium]MBO0744234.1 hypothetical protein [Candidatus Dormibacteraeota bacterium]